MLATMTDQNGTPKVSAKAKRLAREYRRALDEGKTAYAKADDALRKLHAELSPGDRVTFGDGAELELVDNFANGNVAWKPAGVRRLDAKIHKPKRGRKQK